MTEVDSYDMQNSVLLKKLTGEDPIRYEFKGKTSFSEESGTTCLMATNSLPITPDQSDAYYRRWLIIEFPHTFDVGKNVIGDIPKIEYNNLSKKCIRICKELYENKGFTNEGNLKERMKRYEDRSNPLLQFIKTECTENASEHMTLRGFATFFNEYLKKHRLRLMTIRKISKALRDEGFQVKGGKSPIDTTDNTHTTCVYGLIFTAYELEEKSIEVEEERVK